MYFKYKNIGLFSGRWFGHPNYPPVNKHSWLENPPSWNRKYIDSFMVDVPAIAMLVDPGGYIHVRFLNKNPSTTKPKRQCTQIDSQGLPHPGIGAHPPKSVARCSGVLYDLGVFRLRKTHGRNPWDPWWVSVGPQTKLRSATKKIKRPGPLRIPLTSWFY